MVWKRVVSFLKNSHYKDFFPPAVNFNNFIAWAGMGALLLTIGPPGKRVSLKSSL